MAGMSDPTTREVTALLENEAVVAELKRDVLRGFRQHGFNILCNQASADALADFFVANFDKLCRRYLGVSADKVLPVQGRRLGAGFAQEVSLKGVQQLQMTDPELVKRAVRIILEAVPNDEYAEYLRINGLPARQITPQDAQKANEINEHILERLTGEAREILGEYLSKMLSAGLGELGKELERSAQPSQE